MRAAATVLSASALLLAAAGAAALAPVPARAQLMDLLTAPKTLIDRAIEARKAEDIVEDNRIVVEINKVMAGLGTIRASTEIYEQRLLVTGIFDDKSTYDRFRAGVDKVKGIKKLDWHVLHMTTAEQERRKKDMIDWADALVLGTKVRANLIGTRGVADVNIRTAVDAFSTVYVLGRARSQEEMKRAIETIRGTEGVKKVVNYAYVRP